MDTEKQVYDTSKIDWPALKQLAKRVAKETRVPRRVCEAVVENKQRTVSYGFLGIRKRVETYKVETKPRVTDDYWSWIDGFLEVRKKT